MAVPVGGGHPDYAAYLGRSSCSSDGRFVAFRSMASNLTPLSPGLGLAGLYVRDRLTMETVFIAQTSEELFHGGGWLSISADGAFIAAPSDRSDLVPGDMNGVDDLFVFNRASGEVERVSVSSYSDEGNGPSYYPSLSANGRFVCFVSDADNLVPGDSNGVADVFVRDRMLGTTERVSTNTSGVEARPVSTVGTMMVFSGSSGASISGDGRFVAFASSASNLVPSDSNEIADVFVKDRMTGRIVRLSVAQSGALANENSYYTAISGDGRIIAFVSDASNLVMNDRNNHRDVFVTPNPLY